MVQWSESELQHLQLSGSSPQSGEHSGDILKTSVLKDKRNVSGEVKPQEDVVAQWAESLLVDLLTVGSSLLTQPHTLF